MLHAKTKSILQRKILLPLKENYFTSHKDIQKKSDNSISLPHCGDGDYLCKHPKTLLMHARLYVFATRQGLNRLAYVSLQKLYWTLSEFPLDIKQANTIVELLRLSNEMGDINVLMIQYASSHLKTLIRCSSFISFLKEDHKLSYRLFAHLCDSLWAFILFLINTLAGFQSIDVSRRLRLSRVGLGLDVVTLLGRGRGTNRLNLLEETALRRLRWNYCYNGL